MTSMIQKSATLLTHHGSCTLMDQFVMMVKGLVLFLFLRMVLFLNFQIDRKKSAQITKLNMRLFYLTWNSCNPWGVKHVEAFGDSLLVVQQVSKVCQSYNGSQNAYLDK